MLLIIRHERMNVPARLELLFINRLLADATGLDI